jgi:hypothetical protein
MLALLGQNLSLGTIVAGSIILIAVMWAIGVMTDTILRQNGFGVVGNALLIMFGLIGGGLLQTMVIARYFG